MERYPSIRVVGDREDKEELRRRIESNKNIVIRPTLAESLDPPLIVNIVVGLITALKITYDFLKERKKKKIEVYVSLPTGRYVSVKSTNPDDLKVLIEELEETK